MNARALQRAALPLLFGLLLFPIFGESLAWLVDTWSVHPYYSHGPLLPLVALWLLWMRRAQLLAEPGRDLGLVLILLGLALRLAAQPWQAQHLSLLALLIALAGLALAMGGTRALAASAFPLVILALSIPLPFVERLTPAMSASVAEASALVAGQLGVSVVQSGAQLSLPGGAMEVGAPCSGLRSLLALVSLAVILAGLLPGKPGGRLALVVLAAPLALLANGARLVGLLVAADQLGIERGLALFHGLASPAAFLLAILALIGFGQLLGLGPEPRTGLPALSRGGPQGGL